MSKTVQANGKRALAGEEDAKRTHVSQADVPRHALREAMRVPQALADQFAKQATKPLRVAEAIGIAPTTGKFRTLTGASAAYGLTDGTAWAETISLTELGRRAVAPTVEGDDRRALREAFLKPRIVGEFLRRYNNSKFPADRIALNVLTEMGVPAEASERALELIRDGATELGLLRDIKGQLYVDLQNSPAEPDSAGVPLPLIPETISVASESGDSESRLLPPSSPQLPKVRRVFVTHGSNAGVVAQLRELATFANFEPVVAVDRQVTAKPVPDKVIDEMRSCQAGIVHVGTESRFVDENGVEQRVLNSNVLIEIGAALALYGRRFILLVEEGVTLPSNLQGLYKVQYRGERLDYDGTMRLLKALSEFRESATASSG